MMEIIMHYIGALITEIAIIIMFRQVIKEKAYITPLNIIMILIIPIGQVLLNIYNVQIVNPILTILLFIFICKILFKCKFKESIIYLLIIWILGILLDMLMMLITNLVTPNITNVMNETFLRFGSSILMSIVLVLLSRCKFVLRRIKNIYTIISKISLKNSISIVLLFTFFIVELISFLNINNEKIIISEILIGIIIIILVVDGIYKKYHIKEIERTNELLSDNEQTNKSLINEYRIIFHNLESKLRSVESVSNKKAKVLIEEIIKEYKSNTYLEINVDDIPQGLDGIIIKKIANKEDLHLNYKINNKLHGNLLKKLGPKKYNCLFESFGICLDNAIEASSKSQKKILLINFYEREDEIIIQILNTYSGLIDIEKYGSINYTTKKYGNGLGIFSILKNKNVNVKTKIKDNVFIQELTIKKEKNY